MNLRGKVAVVTGGGGGIGKGIVKALADAGADVALADLDGDAAERAANHVSVPGVRTLPIEGDVTSPQSVADMVDATLSWGGQIDILVNNAGVEIIRPIFEISESDWDATLDVNLKGAWLCSQAVAEVMAEDGAGGRLINVGSILAQIPARGEPHYAASKGGVLMLTKSLALDLAPHGITVNAVGPGVVKNGMSSRGCLSDPKMADEVASKVPLQRVGKPADIGDAVVFLASDRASYITGTMLYVDGGLMLATPWD
jgi:NAD(P)-dependent dehydrogenase (short-subunit alcohol dehydrogenase family)